MHPLRPESDVNVRRILLVDDEPDILESLKELLEASLEDVEVVTAESGDKGLEALRGQNLAVIISDFKMPGMNGMEFLGKARQEAPNVPRVLMTAFPDLQIAIQAINEAAIENFFTKPLDPDEVVHVLTTMLERKQTAAQRDRAFARAMRRAEGKEDDE